MSSPRSLIRESPWLPLLFGLWAVAIALAPSIAGKAVLLSPAVLIPLVWWTLQRPERWVAAFLATALLLPPLPIPIGDSGPHPSLVFAALGLFAGILWLGQWRIRLGRVAGALLALFTILLASVAPAAVNSGGPAALGSFARVALLGIAVYIFLYTAGGPGRDTPSSALTRLYYIAVAAALFACVDFYFQFPAPAGYGPQFVWLDTGVFRRAQGLFYEASTLGNFCAFFLVMIAVAFSRPRSESPVPRKALVVGGAIFFAALVLSYSRASALNVLVALFVLAWLNRSRVRFARLVPALVAGAALAAWLTWKLYPAFAEIYWLRISYTAEYLFTGTESVLSGRVSSWRTLVDWVSAHPWQSLIGIGYKTLPYSDYLGIPVVADNMYLSLLVETGIAGLAALVWLNIAVLRAAARAVRSLDPRQSWIGTWLLCFWAGETIQMASGDLLTYWRVLPVYLWVLALAVRD